MKKYDGQIVEVLVEGESKNNPDVLAGYTSKSKLVNFKGPKDIYWSISKSENNRSKNMVIKWGTSEVNNRARGGSIMRRNILRDDIIEKAKEISKNDC